MLVYTTGSVNEDLLRRIEYLLRGELRPAPPDPEAHSPDRPRTPHPRRKPWLSANLLADTATIVSPQTILKWHLT